jgi:membrane protease YdiL (CAAX protease family)
MDYRPAEPVATTENREAFEGTPAPHAGVAVGAIAIYFVTQALVALVLVAAAIVIGGQAPSDTQTLINIGRSGLLNGLVVLISVSLSLPAVYLLAAKVGRQPFGVTIRWRPPERLPTWAGAIIALVAGGLLDALTLALGKPLVSSTQIDLYRGSLPSVALVSVAVVVAAPVMEEILFRGLLYTALGARFGAPTGVVITTVAFGVIHVCTYGTDWYTVLQTIIIGGVLTAMRAWTRSVWPCTVAHVTNNLYGTIETLILLSRA